MSKIIIVIHGYPWLFVLRGYSWLYMVIRVFVVISRNLWLYVVTRGCSWLFEVILELSLHFLY